VGATISKLSVLLSANTAGFQSNLQAAGRGVEDFGNRAAGVTSKLKGMLAPLAGLAGIAGAGAFLSKGVMDAAQLEKDVLAIKTLTGSMEIAEQQMKDLQKFAASTPFQMADLTKSTKMLLAFGVEAEKVQDSLFVLGNLAAVSGAEVSELAQIFGKVKAQGKVTAETLDQMAERAIPVGRALAEHLGVAETAIRELVSAGEIKFADLEAALFKLAGAGGELSTAMAEMAETTAGKWSTLLDNVSMLGIEIAQAFLPTINDLLDSAISVAQALTAMAKTVIGWGNSLSDATGGLISFNSGLKLLRIVAFTVAIPAVIRLIKTIKNLAKAAIVAQAATGAGLVTALVSLAAALALDMGIDSIFSGIESDAEEATEKVGVLKTTIKDLQKQGESIGKLGLSPGAGQPTADQQLISGGSFADLQKEKQQIEEMSARRVAKLKEVNQQLIEAKKLQESGKMSAEQAADFQDEIAFKQKAITHNVNLQNKAQEKHAAIVKEIAKREKEAAKAKKREDDKAWQRARSLTDSAMTQAEKYQEQLREIATLQKGGFLTQEQAAKVSAKVEAQIQSDIDKIVKANADAAAKAEKDRINAWEKASENAAKKSTTELVRFGSKKMYEQIAKAQFKKNNPLATFQKKSTKLQTDQLAALRSIDRKIGAGAAGGGAGAGGGGGGDSPKFEAIGLDDV